MLKKKAEFLKNFIQSSNILWYLVTSSIVSGVPIILLPFFVNRLPVEQYTHIVSFQIVVIAFGLLINLGVDGSVARDAQRLRRRHLASHVSLAICIQFLSFLLLSIITITASRSICQWLSFPPTYLWPSLLGSLFQQQTLLTTNIFRVLGKVKEYSCLSLLFASFEILGSLFFFQYCSENWEARFWGFFVGGMICSVLSFFLLWRTGIIKRPRYIRFIVSRMILFGLPTLPHTILSFLSAWVDRLILVHFCGASVVGLYSVVAQSVSVITFVGSVTILAWTPWLYKYLNSRLNIEDKLRYSMITAWKIAILVTIINLIVYIGIACYFNFYAPPVYTTAFPILGWLAVGAAANSVYKIASSFVFFYGRTLFLAKVSGLGFLFSAIAQFVFVPTRQAIASAVVFAVVNIFQLVCTWIMALRLTSRR